MDTTENTHNAMPRKQIFVWLLISSFSAFARGTTELPPSYAVKSELYATGIEWAEGPAFDRHGDLFVVNYRGNGKIGRIAADGTASVYCDLRPAFAPRDGRQAFPNGLKVDREGRLLVVDLGGGRLLRLSDGGADRSADHGRVVRWRYKKTAADQPPVIEMLDTRSSEPHTEVLVDASGRLYVAISEGGVIDVVDVPSGRLLRQYDAGGRCATNCHFYGGYLYTTITGKEAIYRLKLGVEGFDYWGTMR